MKVDHRIQGYDFRALELHPPDSVTAVAGIAGGPARTPSLVQVPGRAEYLLSETVSSGYADVFGVFAHVGRWMTPDETYAGAHVAVIGDRIWREWFGAEPTIVGHATITIVGGCRDVDGACRLTIVGVAPPGLRGVQTGVAPTEIWLPLGPLPATRTPARFGTNRYMLTFVRTRPGVAGSQVAGEIRLLMSTQPSADPAAASIDVVPASEALRTDELMALGGWALAFSGLVLLAACANLANMLYARGSQRAGEIAVRLSLGAGAGGILRLFAAEAGLVAAAGAGAGLVLAISATRAFGAAFPTFRLTTGALSFDLRPDYRVYFYALVVGVLGAVVVSLLAAWQSMRLSVVRALGAGPTSSIVGSRRRGLPLTFVSVQITAAVLLLIGAGLFIENTRTAVNVRLDYDTSTLAAARVRILRTVGANYVEQSEAHVSRARAFFDSLVASLRARPGVEHAAIANNLPGGTAPAPENGGGNSHLVALDAPRNAPGGARRLNASWIWASPGFFAAIDVPLIAGRDFRPGDTYGAPAVAILSRSAADGLWPGEDAIGKQITCCRVAERAITVVGVAADPVGSSDTSPWTRASNYVFLSAAQGRNTEMDVVVRSAAVATSVEAIRETSSALDEDAAVFYAGPVNQFLLAGVAVQRAERVLTTSLGVLALGIAMLGVYGVVSYFVSRRTREFGLRLALGAMPRQILKLVVDYAVHIILIGLLPGVLLASLGTRLFEHQLFGIMPNGITMWVVAPMLMLAAGVVAGLVPARRAARVDPNVTLRDL